MDTFSIVLITMMCVLLFISVGIAIIQAFIDSKEKEEDKQEEQENRLSSLKNDISDTYRYFRQLEQEVICLRCKVDCLEKKSKSLNKGKIKK